VQFDVKNRRTFLKRCDYPSVTLDQLNKGSKVTIYSRQLTVMDYADAATAQYFSAKMNMCAPRQNPPQRLTTASRPTASGATGIPPTRLRA